MNTREFQRLIRQKGCELYRNMPWREQPSFYYVLVSEIMLQQTQVSRVMPKFHEFTTAFPTAQVLANASLADVIKLWQGLGYNRRAKYLHEAAKAIQSTGEPRSQKDILLLPGVGKNTAGAIMSYVYQVPTSFIETNIRSVYLHHFFKDQSAVDDRELMPLIEATLDKSRPREWFWALMDYGTWLKAQKQGSIAKSRHYKKQSPLKGSVREVRGQIIRAVANGSQEVSSLRKRLSADERFEIALAGLEREQLITVMQDKIYLTE